MKELVLLLHILGIGNRDPYFALNTVVALIDCKKSKEYFPFLFNFFNKVVTGGPCEFFLHFRIFFEHISGHTEVRTNEVYLLNVFISIRVRDIYFEIDILIFPNVP